jgi:ketosteroid isomerase-like protein
VDNVDEVFRTAQFVVAFTLAFVVASSSIGLAGAPDDNLVAARAAYNATQYEDALRILSAPGAGTSDQADVYRALCLLALGRMGEVDGVLRALAARNPAFRMSEAEVTPKMIALFEDVRRTGFEALVRDAYTSAKAHFDAGRYAEASTGFESVLGLIASHGLASREGSSVNDLRLLSRGFKQLADSEVARSDRTRREVSRDPAAPAFAGSPSDLPAPRPETIIEGVIQRYALAYSALDARAVTKVFPSEDSNLLKSAFSKLKAQNAQARNVAVTLDPGGQAATVSMMWSVEAVPKVGTTVRAQRVATLRMARTPTGDWNIVERR